MSPFVSFPVAHTCGGVPRAGYQEEVKRTARAPLSAAGTQVIVSFMCAPGFQNSVCWQLAPSPWISGSLCLTLPFLIMRPAKRTPEKGVPLLTIALAVRCTISSITCMQAAPAKALSNPTATPQESPGHLLNEGLQVCLGRVTICAAIQGGCCTCASTDGVTTGAGEYAPMPPVLGPVSPSPTAL